MASNKRLILAAILTAGAAIAAAIVFSGRHSRRFEARQQRDASETWETESGTTAPSNVRTTSSNPLDQMPASPNV